MTTREAFEKLIAERGWYEQLGITKTTAWSAVDRYKQGKLSIEKMENLLQTAGYRVKTEKEWVI